MVIYTPNDDKSILDIDSVIKTVDEDDILFPSNANFYNIYMNQKDEVGIKGRLSNYVLDKHLENEVFERIFHTENSDTFPVQFKFPLSGVWEVDMFLNVDDGNQGKICKYQMVFKQNSVYSVANVQKLTNHIEWGNNITLSEPSLDKLGNVSFTFTDTTHTNRTQCVLKLKARRIMSYDYSF